MNWTLGPESSYSCPVKVRHAFTPGLQPPVESPALPTYVRAARGAARAMVDRFGRACGRGVVDLRPLGGEPIAVRSAASVRAMESGARLILGARLPDDPDGHRRGTVDILVRGADTRDGRPGYLPIQVQGRRVLEVRPHASVRLSPFTAPEPESATEAPGLGFRWAKPGDRLQLAHLRLLLDAVGHASAGPRFGGLIGTDRRAVAWSDLDADDIAASPRTSDGSGTSSVMERYTDEFAIRIATARAAMAGEAPTVLPIRTRECELCNWWPVCEPLIPADDISMRIDKWPLDVHEITALRSLGVSSVPELAAADVEELLPGYEARVAHRQGIDDRLRAAARRARLMESGIELERVATGSVPMPAAALEIDLDIEASADNRVYLWGFLVHDTAVGASPYYRPFAAFESLSQEQEAELAIEAFGWLRAKVEEKDSLVFHYSDYEVVRLAQIAAGSEGLDWAMGFAGTRFVDLFTIVKQNFFGVHGLGLKNVAHTGAGFSWRDPDPGGLNSQAWFEDALRGPARGRLASRQRILAYNEDDVRATWQLRQWLRTLT